MIHLIDNIRKNRQQVLNIIQDLSLEKLNKIPHSFNNNIIWNVGHLIAAQQTICYIRPGLTPPLPEDAYKKFSSGTRPEQFFESDVEDALKKLLFTSLDTMEREYQQNVFAAFKPWVTKSGYPINSIDDALIYMHIHEGLHTGIIFCMKKLVQK